MQAIMETSFDVVYLISVITIGILMVAKAKGNKNDTLFGIMATPWAPGMPSIWCRALSLCVPPDWKTSPLPLESENSSPPSP